MADTPKKTAAKKPAAKKTTAKKTTTKAAPKKVAAKKPATKTAAKKPVAKKTAAKKAPAKKPATKTAAKTAAAKQATKKVASQKKTLESSASNGALHYDKVALLKEYSGTFDMMMKATVISIGCVLLYFFMMVTFLGGFSHEKTNSFAEHFGDRIDIGANYDGLKLPMYSTDE